MSSQPLSTEDPSSTVYDSDISLGSNSSTIATIPVAQDPVNLTRTGPLSWIFYVVARMADYVHQPLAVVVSPCHVSQRRMMFPATIADISSHIMDIFSDEANVDVIEAEVALAKQYYDDNPYIRPQASVGSLHDPAQRCPSSSSSTDAAASVPEALKYTGDYEFPYIMTLLLQGVALRRGRCETAGLAYAVGLHTVYRETRGDWGMVVVDISDLLCLRYGIVAHPSSEERFHYVTSNDAAVAGAASEEPPPPSPTAAEAEDDDAWDQDALLEAPDFVSLCMPFDVDELENEVRLSQWPLIETEALQTIWPERHGISLPPSQALSNMTEVGDAGNVLDEYLSLVIRQTDELKEAHVPDYEVEQFTTKPEFVPLLWKALQAQPKMLGKGRAAGELLALAFGTKKHMGLEIFRDLKANALDAVMEEERRRFTALKSISMCADTFAVHPAVLAGMLAGTRATRIYFVRRLGGVVDVRDTLQFEMDVLRAIAESHGQALRQKRFFFSSAFCAVLRGNDWLPLPLPTQRGGGRERRGGGPSEEEHFLSQLTKAYPVMNLIVQQERAVDDPVDTALPCFSVRLMNCLLTPERLATGLLAFMRLYGGPGGREESGLPTRLVAFSASPGVMAQSTRSTRFSRDLAMPFPECFRRPQNPASIRTVAVKRSPYGLVPGEWTALVARGVDTSVTSKLVRYALVRLRKSSTSSTSSGTPSPVGTSSKLELEVVGLEAFLKYTAPHVDPLEVRQRLYELAVHLVRCNKGRSLPPRGAPMATHPIAVLTEVEAKRLLMHDAGN